MNEGGKDLLRKCSMSVSTPFATPASSCFDCYICLELVAEPVVTLCGHLYCWSCIYKWLQIESKSSQQCPVCKAPLSRDTIVPLYGRSGPSEKSASEIPLRSSLHCQATKASISEHHSSGTSQEVYGNINPSMRQPRREHSYRYHPSPSSLLASPVFHSLPGGLVGGLLTSFLPWVFKNQGTSMYNTRRHLLSVSGNNPRLRTYQVQVESSLQRTWILLLCFALLCLIFF